MGNLDTRKTVPSNVEPKSNVQWKGGVVLRPRYEKVRAISSNLACDHGLRLNPLRLIACSVLHVLRSGRHACRPGHGRGQ